MILKEGMRHFINSTLSFVEAYDSGINITALKLGERHSYNHRILVPTLDKLRKAGIVVSQIG